MTLSLHYHQMRQRVNKPQRSDTGDLLLEVREKIYMRSVSGVFARWRWSMVFITQLVFYGLPWMTWNEREAVLFDLAARQFYLFGIILYPQDFIYLTALLVICAMSLFLFTTVAGRLWCGYACPQTVYTEIFMWIERQVEGERGHRMKLDRQPMSVRKFRLKAIKHGLWVLVALWTGITFVGYFTPIRELLVALLTVSLGPWQMFWVLFYAFATYGNAGFLREQVCQYMCPYARFQGVMFDRDTLVITYDAARGEPRGSRPIKADASALAMGDCIDCKLCVQVCPTGIDIRQGQQYECIGCAACIDACDRVMNKVGYPTGLIRYDTLNGVEHGWTRNQLWRRVFRPRVLVYTGIVLAASVALLMSLMTRSTIKMDVMRDRGSLSREVGNGEIENVYRLMLINSAETQQSATLMVEGLTGIYIDSTTEVMLEAASNRLVPVRVRVNPAAGQSGSNTIYFVIQPNGDGQTAVREKSTFVLPHLP